MAILFRLDKESVFDEKFWDKFNEWGVAHSRRVTKSGIDIAEETIRTTT